MVKGKAFTSFSILFLLENKNRGKYSAGQVRITSLEVTPSEVVIGYFLYTMRINPSKYLLKTSFRTFIFLSLLHFFLMSFNIDASPIY